MDEREFLRQAASINGISRQRGVDADFEAAIAMRDSLVARGLVKRIKDHVPSDGDQRVDLFVATITPAGVARLIVLGG